MTIDATEDGPLVQRAVVLGGGTMGLGIAQVLAVAGIEVALCDASLTLTRNAVTRLQQRTRMQVDSGLRELEDMNSVAGVYGCFPPEDAVASTDLVCEAAPEDLPLKRSLLHSVSRAAPAETVIATNTSSFPIDELAEHVDHPERFLGLHWFSPPEWVPGVEVIAGSSTAPEVVQGCHRLLRRLGKCPTDVASSPAFVANRIQMALFLEAVSCVEDCLASAEQVDEIVRSTFGFRLPNYGPFQIADMAGLDVYLSVLRTLQDGVGARFAPPPRLVELVEQGRFGTKTGAGFGEYSADEADQLMRHRDTRYAAMARFLGESQASDGSDADA
jgi:3-hydroxybutyryl-CoA dehydrogenase